MHSYVGPQLNDSSEYTPDNPSVQQFLMNTVSLVQQGDIYRDLKTMNVKGTKKKFDPSRVDEPLPRRPRHVGIL